MIQRYIPWVEKKEFHDDEYVEMKYDNDGEYVKLSDVVELLENEKASIFLQLLPDENIRLETIDKIISKLTGKETTNG